MALEVRYEYDPDAQQKAAELFRQAAAHALYMGIGFGALVDELRPIADHRERVDAAAAKECAEVTQRVRKAFGKDGELDGVMTIPVPWPKSCSCDGLGGGSGKGATFTPTKLSRSMGE